VKYLPVVALLIALVAVMGGMNSESFKATRSIVLTIAAFIVIAALFGLVLKRTL
jgi:Na+(H+)/acetate symporter ActP